MPIAWCIGCWRRAARRWQPVAAEFPAFAPADGGIDRARLGQRVFSDPEALARLERIIHPMVEAGGKRFLGLCRARRVPIVALDIPLLFESGSERRCDYVLVVSAPALDSAAARIAATRHDRKSPRGDPEKSNAGSRETSASRFRGSDRR